MWCRFKHLYKLTKWDMKRGKDHPGKLEASWEMCKTLLRLHFEGHQEADKAKMLFFFQCSSKLSQVPCDSPLEGVI